MKAHRVSSEGCHASGWIPFVAHNVYVASLLEVTPCSEKGVQCKQGARDWKRKKENRAQKVLFLLKQVQAEM